MIEISCTPWAKLPDTRDAEEKCPESTPGSKVHNHVETIEMSSGRELT